MYVGEIRMIASDYAPDGWRLCDGGMLAISDHESLYSLIGSTYGGDDRTFFHVPDLRGRAPVHIGRYQSTQFQLGERGGTEQVTLSLNQLPAHTHELIASDTPATLSIPQSLAAGGSIELYNSGPPDSSLLPVILAPAGGSQSHENMQPFLVINFIIALNGEYPPHP